MNEARGGGASGASGSPGSQREPAAEVSRGDIALTHGSYAAFVSPIGAALTRLSYRERDLIVPFEHGTRFPPYGGALLAPWPNRVIHAQYTSADHGTQRLAVTETDRGHALHGLVVNLRFDVIERGESQVTLATVIDPQQGYPWRIRIETTFELTDGGLAQTVAATNESATAALFGTGCHPYLTTGTHALDECELSLPASLVQLTQGEQLVPGAVVSVAVDPSRFDFRQRRRLGTASIDHAFTGLHAEQDGQFVARLTAPDGHGVEMVWDQRCPWVQLYTADTAPQVRIRVGLAIEPMTCPPDAFNSGVDLTPLPPGASTSAEWRITAIDPHAR